MRNRAFALFATLALAPAAFPAALPANTQEFLRRVGKTVDESLRLVQSVNCLETVHQTKLDTKGKKLFDQETEFDYVVVFQLTPDNLVIDESRSQLPQQAPPKPKKQDKQQTGRVALLTTNGFPTFAFIFHPFYQDSFEYSAPEQVLVEGKHLVRIQFRHVHGARSPSVLRIKAREYPIEWEGSAWFDPNSGALVRIAASLETPLSEIGLSALDADVRYAPVQFKETTGAHMLPASATIDAESQHQRWRNTHTFSNYRQFTVDVKTEVSTPK